NEVGDDIVSLSEIMTRINRTLDARRSEIGDRLKMTPRQYYSRITNNAGEFFFLSLRRPVISNMDRMRLTNIPDIDAASEAIAAETKLAPKHSRLFAIKPNREIKQLTSAPPSAVVKSFSECEQICRDSSLCRSFSYQTTNGYCFTTTAALSEKDLY